MSSNKSIGCDVAESLDKYDALQIKEESIQDIKEDLLLENIVKVEFFETHDDCNFNYNNGSSEEDVPLSSSINVGKKESLFVENGAPLPIKLEPVSTIKEEVVEEYSDTFIKQNIKTEKLPEEIGIRKHKSHSSISNTDKTLCYEKLNSNRKHIDASAFTKKTSNEYKDIDDADKNCEQTLKTDIFETKKSLETVSTSKTHSDKNLYRCDICSKNFKNKRNLTIHVRTHTGEKPFSCDICSYRSNQSTSLKVHLRTHTGEKPYSCNICSYRSSQSSSLKSHLRTHTGEKRYSCSICSYKCKEISCLNSHIKIHTQTNVKPFSCKLCSYKIYYLSDFISHLGTHSAQK